MDKKKEKTIGEIAAMEWQAKFQTPERGFKTGDGKLIIEIPEKQIVGWVAEGGLTESISGASRLVKQGGVRVIEVVLASVLMSVGKKRRLVRLILETPPKN